MTDSPSPEALAAELREQIEALVLRFNCCGPECHWALDEMTGKPKSVYDCAMRRLGGNHEQRLTDAIFKVLLTYAARVRKEAQQWRDIKTAPRDGTEILLRRGDRVSAGAWITWPDQDTPGGFMEGGSAWQTWDGGFTEEESPTDWQPLPDRRVASIFRYISTATDSYSSSEETSCKRPQ